MDSLFVVVGLVVSPLVALALAALTLMRLIWALTKRRWLLSAWMFAAAIAVPFAVYAAVYQACRGNDVVCQFYGLFSAEIASVVALVIAWVIASSNVKVNW